MIATDATVILPEAVWRERQRAHAARVQAWADPHQARAGHGEKHPGYAFLVG